MTQNPAAAAARDPNAPLLSGDFMRKLDQLDVISRKILAGKLQGERRSKQRGQSVEFADYRPYVVGDDLRFIDWNLYARLDKLFLRLFLEEEDLLLAVIVDATKSMDYGEPNKLDYTRQVAAALGYVGLVNYNRVTIASFAETITGELTNLRGRRPIPRMLEFLESLEPSPQAGRLAEATRRFALTHRQKGVVVVVSDFLDKGDLDESLKFLSGDRYDVFLLQLLSPQEIDPQRGQVIGDLRLRDVEDGDTAEVSITAALLDRYKANLQAHCDHVRHVALRRGMSYLFSDTSRPFDELVLRYLRERGLVG